ncbi:MAG: SMC-Scp complex subunit ScpB [Gammaproteobacteria bacterium]|nr:SMC-Scp complex subunit ScpB [Gammaproteobacteria bacterium]
MSEIETPPETSASAVNPEVKNIVEAALLVAGQPLTLDRMAAMFPEDSRPTRDEIRDVLQQLEQEYAERGIELKQIEKAYRLQTREKYSSWLARLVEERPARYSRALLETLAIIAYRQPVTRGDIEDIRGVGVSTEIIKTLMQRDWIREVGRKEVPGRPALYGTTREFLEYFSLGKLDELPPLAELRDIALIGAELDARAAAGEAVARGEASTADNESTGDGNTANESPTYASASDETAEAEPTPELVHSASSTDE